MIRVLSCTLVLVTLCSCTSIEPTAASISVAAPVDSIRLESQNSSMILSEVLDELHTAIPLSDSEYEHLERWQAVNQDVKAVLRITGLDIYEPVICNAQSNKQWLRTNIYGEPDIAGSIFLDCRSDVDRSAVKLIHGHNMKNGSMFGRVPELLEIEKCEDAPLIELLLETGVERYKVFSVMSVDASKEALPIEFLTDYDDLQSLGQDLLARSIVPGGFLDSLDFVILNTCWYGESGRARNLHCIVSACRVN